jgi:ferrous iron transport protein B
MLEKITLIGVPNVGKTTLYNQLTGKENLVGNWDGVTTEIANSQFNCLGSWITIEDLPGCYSLITSHQMSLEEQSACKYIHSNLSSSFFINLVNIETIERDLYLTLQLLEQRANVLIVVNINDKNLNHKLYKRTYSNLINYLQQNLGVKVICCNVVTGFGIDKLKKAIITNNRIITEEDKSHPVLKKYIPYDLFNNLQEYAKLGFNSIGELIRFLEGDVILGNVYQNLSINFQSFIQSKDSLLMQENMQWDLFFATKRHEFINETFIYNFKNLYSSANNKITDRIDQIFLHKYFGLPLFLLITYLMFFCVINISDTLQGYIHSCFIKLICNPFNNLLNMFFAPDSVLLILNEGVFIGFDTLIKFIPVLFFMYLFLFFLENSGYIGRAMFLADRLMISIGLSGKSLIPMIIGFGCNVPAIAGARVIEQQRDKIITILMTPFMSCSARLVTYSVFATTFFSSQQGNVIFYLYIVGIISGIFTGFLLQKFLLGSKANLLLELPNYSIPSLKLAVRKSMYKVKGFLKNASFIVIVTCISISLLKHIGFCRENILFNLFSKYVMPVFEPMGISQQNWPAIAGLFSGLIAKEAIIGSLNALYSTNNTDLLVVLSNQFGNYKSAFAYLLFVLLSFPCVSVVTIISKELNIKWAIFSVLWSTVLAYTVATFYYQFATFNEHPMFSLKLSAYLLFLIIVVLLIMKNRLSVFNKKIINETIIPINIGP